jgi:hypothetical protein
MNDYKKNIILCVTSMCYAIELIVKMFILRSNTTFSKSASNEA